MSQQLRSKRFIGKEIRTERSQGCQHDESDDVPILGEDMDSPREEELCHGRNNALESV